jgi:Flp pilus assembly protein CpaB
MQAILTSRIFSTRGGTIAVGVAAAALAGLLLLVYLNRYRANVAATGAPASVLVAKQLIPKGTSGTIIASQGLFELSRVPKDQLKLGAIADPAVVAGRDALADIYPNQQLTVGDFSVAPTNAVATRITGDERAISIPIDSAHGLIGQLRPGDRVDVYVGLNVGEAGGSRSVLGLLAPNQLVLEAPSEGGGGGPGAGNASSNIVLKVKTTHAAKLAFAADNGKIWLVLRPQSGAKPTKPSIATVRNLLLGVAPLRAGEGG